MCSKRRATSHYGQQAIVKALFSAARQEASPCIELGCWAHVRRKFFDLHKANASSMALEALTRIGQLYVIEQQGNAQDIEARQQLHGIDPAAWLRSTFRQPDALYINHSVKLNRWILK